MVEPITVGILIFGVLISGAVVYFWEQILIFIQNHILPWIETNFPEYKEIALEALMKVDNAISALKRKVKAAWAQLREYLLKVLVSYEKTADGWVKEVISWCVVKLREEEKIVKRTEKVVANHEEIPDEVREQFLRRRTKKMDQDVTEQRDQELGYTY